MTDSTHSGASAGIIALSDGRPVILHDGQPVRQSAYCDYIQRGDWEERIREFVESGVAVFCINPNGLKPVFGGAVRRTPKSSRPPGAYGESAGGIYSFTAAGGQILYPFLLDSAGWVGRAISGRDADG